MGSASDVQSFEPDFFSKPNPALLTNDRLLHYMLEAYLLFQKYRDRGDNYQTSYIDTDRYSDDIYQQMEDTAQEWQGYWIDCRDETTRRMGAES